ncbi:sulfite exporter TauE/SafE family protein [Halobacteria archaeon AArc-curdl1]|uniref:Sulfite exporter TauE/SafE family protein n=1 Tax=Natronosalvus hydrolyticus TaxID=2979988 RepID=A0AAP3E7P4_9EURY|nr:sulfite exporter TauE/SafE family protein [Halobacteria archaeon AArc-curdl1]
MRATVTEPETVNLLLASGSTYWTEVIDLEWRIQDVVATTHDHGTSVTAANVDLLVFLFIGVLAGAHCLGMCGPLVTTYADRMRKASDSRSSGSRRGTTLTTREVRQHALFNLGRAGSYALLGGLFGLVGALTFTSAGALANVGDPIRGATGILVGIAIIASGLYYLRGQPGIPHGIPVVSPVFGWLSRLLTGRIDRLANSPGIVGLGAIHGLLPCPIIYPAYLYAFALGDPVRGALSLAALGVGTIPTLFAYGTLLGSLSPTTRVRLHRALGAGFLVLGYVPLQHGLMLYGIHLPHPHIPFYQPL